MRYYYICCLLLRHIATVLVACQDTLPTPESPCENGVCSMPSHIQSCSPRGSCKDGICITNNGIFRTGQYLKGYINPNATIVSAQNYIRNLTLAQLGDIIIRSPGDKPKLRSAILDGLIYRDDKRFYRNIIDIHNGDGIGCVWVERPIPDSDTRVGNLRNHSMPAAMPSAVRPWVDPASLVPSYTNHCAFFECIPVSIGQIRF